METLSQLYKSSLALLTDLYQLTMAYGYWKLGIGQREAVFHLLFRKHPFDGGYAIACGLQQAIEYLQQSADLKTAIWNTSRPSTAMTASRCSSSRSLIFCAR